MQVSLPPKRLQIFNAVNNTLTAALDYLEQHVSGSAANASDGPTPEAIPHGFRPEKQQPVRPKADSDGGQAHSAKGAGPASSEHWDGEHARAYVRPSNHASTAPGENESGHDALHGSGTAEAEEPSQQVRVPQAAASRNESKKSAGSWQPNQHDRDAAAVSCCEALAFLLGDMHHALAERLLPLMPRICHWVCTGFSEADAAGAETRLQAVAALVPVLNRIVCQRTTEEDRDVRKEGIKVLSCGECAGALASAIAVVCAKILADQASADAVQQRMRASHLGGLCNVLAAVMPSIDNASGAHMRSALARCRRRLTQVELLQQGSGSDADSCGLGCAAAALCAVLSACEDSARTAAVPAASVPQADSQLIVVRLLIMHMHTCSADGAASVSKTVLPVLVNGLRQPVHTLLVAGLAQMEPQLAQSAVPDSVLQQQAQLYCTSRRHSSAAQVEDDKDLDHVFERMLQCCASLEALKGALPDFGSVLCGNTWLEGCAEGKSTRSELFGRLQATPLTAPLVKMLNDLIA